MMLLTDWLTQACRKMAPTYFFCPKHLNTMLPLTSLSPIYILIFLVLKFWSTKFDFDDANIKEII